ncbi:MAG: aminotransferase [Cellvibrionales bacterium]|nr:aminotransferase [Cellvibrionales bacterium]
MHIDQASTVELSQRLSELEQQHQAFIDLQLTLDLTRGKPSSAQLDLSNGLLDTVNADNFNNDHNIDPRNYGVLDGLPAAKDLFGSILSVTETDIQQRVFVGGNSSLTLMHYTVWFAFHFGLKIGDQAWASQVADGEPIKMLCPCPGYDRHFSLCAQFGIEMIPVALTGKGPDMDQVEALVKADSSIKGIWCVPRFANPTGEVYSEETVTRLAGLGKIAGDNFLVLWDNAYAVHSLNDKAKPLASIDAAAKSQGTLDHVVQFGSSSKITFAGAGIGYLSSSEANVEGFTRNFGMATIGSDKINQLRHVRFLKDLDGVRQHMAKHAAIINPKFAAVTASLETHIKDTGMGRWSNPEGGYFVSFETLPGLAKTVVSLAAEAGVKLTPAGATFPNGNDPQDCNIRLAPTFPELEDVETAMAVFVNCVQLASIQQKIPS